MAISIGSNIASLSAQRNLASTQKSLGSNFSKLSSGMRIATAADDAAGLGISERLKAQVRGLNQASRNANDGISLLQTAEGAMNEIAGSLTRLRELAVQSANGTLGTQERGYINNEAAQLTQEIDRISAVTEFNGNNMLGADAGTFNLQVGTMNTGNDVISATTVAADSATLGVGGLDLSTQAGAQAAIDAIDTAIDTLSSNRATLGGVQNRLQVTITNLASASENNSAANSRIRDIDVAEETANMTRNQILSQAGVAILSQANQIPSAALSLLRG